jgi:hypothetical protein
MYHIEFYQRMMPFVEGGNPFLSGIVGDLWAGGIDVPPIDSPDDLDLLGYTHGLHADSSQCLLDGGSALREQFWEEHRRQLRDPMLRVLWVVRLKIMLLSYLLRVPRSFGFQPWSPFLDSDIALSMLSLPREQHENRQWQQDFFREQDIYFEEKDFSFSTQNNLNHQAMRKVPVPPLDEALLGSVVRTEYIRWINRNVSQQGRLWDWFWSLQQVPKVGGLLRRFGIREQRLDAYKAYLTLKPIETLLNRRDGVA